MPVHTLDLSFGIKTTKLLFKFIVEYIDNKYLVKISKNLESSTSA